MKPVKPEKVTVFRHERASDFESAHLVNSVGFSGH